MNRNPTVVRVMGLPPSPSMPNHGDLLACRTNANHLARLACGVIPCDKYNHYGGEGFFRIAARNENPVGRLRYLMNHSSTWKKSLTLPHHPSASQYWPVNESQPSQIFLPHLINGFQT